MEIDNSLISNVYYDNMTSGYHQEMGIQALALTDVVAKLVNTNFQWRFTTLLVVNQFNIHMIDIFLKQVLKPIVINYGKLEENYIKNVTQFIIFGKGEEQISTALEWIYTPEHISKFIIVCEDPMKCNEDILFKNANNKNIYNVVFVKSDDDGTVKVLSHRYINLFSCDHNDKLHKINCSIHPGQKNDTCLRSIFNDHHFLDFIKCHISFAVGHSPPYMNLHNSLEPSGSIYYFLRLISKMANFKFVLKVGNHLCSDYLKNDGKLLNSVQADATLCGVPMFIKKIKSFETSCPLGTFEVVWVNTFDQSHSEWIKLVYPLDYDLRVAIFAVFVSIILFNCFLKTKLTQRMFSLKNSFTNRSLLLASWAIFLGLPVRRASSNASFKIMVFTWLWFCFIVRSAYLGNLYNTLNTKTFKPHITNIHDIHRLGYKYGGQAAYRELYVDEPKIYNNWVVLKENLSVEILDEILAGTSDFTLAFSKAKIIDAAYNQKKHLNSLNIFPRRIFSGHTNIYFRKYSGLASYVNRITEISVESGFYSYIEARYIRHHIGKEFHKINNMKPFDLSDLRGPLFIWFTGIVISIIYFAVEIICERC